MPSENNDEFWLKILDGTNQEIMSDNEYSLGIAKAVVDFDNAGQFPERLSGLLMAVHTGLSHVGVELMAATFCILPYVPNKAPLTRPVLFSWKPANEARRRTCPAANERGMCEHAVMEAEKLVDPPMLESGLHTVQIPYFVMPIGEQSRPDFYGAQFVYKTPVLIKDRSRDVAWVEAHPPAAYVQRFLFTIILRAKETDVQRLLGSEGKFLNHLLGAFLSWVGIAADEISRFELERVASFQLLRAHQLGNELKALFDFERETLAILEEDVRNPTQETVRKTRRVLNKWRDFISNVTDKLRMFSQVASVLGARREGFNWYVQFLHCLKEFGATLDPDGKTYIVEAGGSWRTGTIFDLSGVQEGTKGMRVFYTPYHFDELITNLFKNAKRMWDHTRNDVQRFHVTACQSNGHLKFSLANEGEAISEPLKAKLFRHPVPKDPATKGSGMGLWALGMSLKTFGIPFPSIENETDFGPCFTFLFPAEATTP
jgi:hypothetical protein